MSRFCADCGAGESANLSLWDEGYDFAFWTGEPRYTLVCGACWHRRDNYDPPDPDGEAFSGGEAAAYQAEQMHAARRLK